MIWINFVSFWPFGQLPRSLACSLQTTYFISLRSSWVHASRPHPHNELQRRHVVHHYSPHDIRTDDPSMRMRSRPKLNDMKAKTKSEIAKLNCLFAGNNFFQVIFFLRLSFPVFICRQRQRSNAISCQTNFAQRLFFCFFFGTYRTCVSECACARRCAAPCSVYRLIWYMSGCWCLVRRSNPSCTHNTHHICMYMRGDIDLTLRNNIIFCLEICFSFFRSSCWFL